MRRDTFELQRQVDPEFTSDKQLKKDVNRCQGKIAGIDVVIGRGRI